LNQKEGKESRDAGLRHRQLNKKKHHWFAGGEKQGRRSGPAAPIDKKKASHQGDFQQEKYTKPMVAIGGGHTASEGGALTEKGEKFQPTKSAGVITKKRLPRLSRRKRGKKRVVTVGVWHTNLSKDKTNGMRRDLKIGQKKIEP